ncbi:MAG: NAD(P)-binding domain-containing protein [Flavobacteriales bacterium]|nr:NAD(P)-binding domain-containing protein [Flavobacteriales bacterium]
MKKKIGIIGSGIVAKTLGAGCLKHGYEVMLGTRDTSKLSEWNATHPEAKIGSFEEAAAFGDIVILAVSGRVAKDALAMAGKQHLSGKTVIDTTNPIAEAPPENGVLRFFTNLDESLMEQIQHAYPDVHFVKSFSCVGNAFMVDPAFESKPSMFICGDDAQAKSVVSSLLHEFGWEVEDMGNVEAARAIEPLCMLWCIPGMRENKWSHAFRLMKN